MTLGEVIQSMRLDLRKHFIAHPYKHHATRRKNAEKQILAIYGVTVDRLVANGDIPWKHAAGVKQWAVDFRDIIVNQWVYSATGKMYETYEAKMKQTG